MMCVWIECSFQKGCSIFTKIWEDLVKNCENFAVKYKICETWIKKVTVDKLDHSICHLKKKAISRISENTTLVFINSIWKISDEFVKAPHKFSIRLKAALESYNSLCGTLNSPLCRLSVPLDNRLKLINYVIFPFNITIKALTKFVTQKSWLKSCCFKRNFK